MKKVVLYIACSLDGYIAEQNDDLNWLTAFPNPENTDYGYTEFLSTIGSTIMGRKTYEIVLNIDPDWTFYKEINSYIVSSDRNLKILSPDTFLADEDIISFVNNLKKSQTKNIWLIGGGVLIREFLNLDLIDEMTITFIPKILGKGIRLFPEISKQSEWLLTNSQSFNNGIVNLSYEKIKTS